MLGFALMLGAMLASTASLVIRFRRSHGVERQQLKWVTAAAALFLVIFVFPTDLLGGDDLGFASLLLGLLVVAGAIAISMLRYRLYDIDVVIRRTLTYGALTATLAAAYLALRAAGRAGRRRVGPRGRRVDARRGGAVPARRARASSGTWTAASSAAATTPRRRCDAFGGRVRDEIDLEALADDLRRVVRDTVAPAHVSLWLRRARNDSRTHGA